ncbi:hypothetical protein B1759_00990 [Rubrivirga sp. SAORIC476]|uniref:hypothetical protein n=1 Tax=Rubrivirga sp. SAORIC476 TaxID=1961794 RepID=UPI000BA92767|nr:hypothetical protein [Rubrivirga sp. SAORIC476]PAP82357.1 hypothetical protein B1759_00990 [Rubrivirga sp. SAORIC476]
MNAERKYWLVGANWSGDDQAEAFYRRGYWEIGYSDSEKPNFAARRDRMEAGDRVAIKSMRGRGADTITIKALGTVKEVYDGKVFIDWLVTDLHREVESKGCFKTIHGPYGAGREPEWVKEVFHI